MQNNKSSSSTLSDPESSVLDSNATTLANPVAIATFDALSEVKLPHPSRQKDKQRHFQTSKSKDSSSSNGSIEISSIIKLDDQPPIQWKYSRTHQKRFHRRFPTIDENEQLIDCNLT
jgi:hypothetical protein